MKIKLRSRDKERRKERRERREGGIWATQDFSFQGGLLLHSTFS